MDITPHVSLRLLNATLTRTDCLLIILFRYKMAAPSKADTQKRLAKAEEELSQVNDRLKEIEERDNAALQEMHEKLTGEIEVSDL